VKGRGAGSGGRETDAKGAGLGAVAMDKVNIPRINICGGKGINLGDVVGGRPPSREANGSTEVRDAGEGRGDEMCSVVGGKEPDHLPLGQ
jgi:hypothetical protein